MIDLVVITCERLELLKRTLGHIRERTTTPHRLHVIDDASTEGNAQYIRDRYAIGEIYAAHLHRRRVGIPANLRALARITQSDPIVFTDDDVLCPLVRPDWLARGLLEMATRPTLGMLALNNPQCNIDGKRGGKQHAGRVTYCRNVPGNFVLVRREVLRTCAPQDGMTSPVKEMCARATAQGWRVGYLRHVYCQHIGAVSVRNGRDLSAELALVAPTDPYTLEPADAYKG